MLFFFSTTKRMKKGKVREITRAYMAAGALGGKKALLFPYIIIFPQDGRVQSSTGKGRERKSLFMFMKDGSAGWFGSCSIHFLFISTPYNFILILVPWARFGRISASAWVHPLTHPHTPTPQASEASHTSLAHLSCHVHGTIRERSTYDTVRARRGILLLFLSSLVFFWLEQVEEVER
ncbi:hypothetical protein B0J18DRAFT_265558 [Chaetomium sp. MPI-SDFR-AT-0129]|nr:hypothetical protein B0J18DRAFT_265558 [Chaetomium sp. MPI-SDFR-AT-0129]